MRQDYPRFQERNTEVIAIGSASRASFQRFWAREAMPFPGVSDPNKHVLKLYGQEFKWHKFGRMPAMIIVDTAGIVRWIHYGSSASDIPANDDILTILETLPREDLTTSQ